jgi:DNA polymerase I-like protein with 3'-5' exonuclease and polymerase domains
MLRGVRIDQRRRESMAGELLTTTMEFQNTINYIVGFDLNVRSNKQMKEFFYTALKLPLQYQRKTGRVSLDEAALNTLARREPLVKPLITYISNLRSMGVFLSTFIQAPLDIDGRMRCSFNPAGTETFRFSSSENAFGSGTNLQNIPKGDEALHLPNIRSIFIPDPNYTMFDIDLSGADAQVVAWEADDDSLKEIFREGKKIAAVGAKAIYGSRAGEDGKNEPFYSRAKAGIHLTNYGGKARTAGQSMGISTAEAEEFQSTWFRLHPGIRDWHTRVEMSLQTTRSVENKFNYRRLYFDRIDGLLPQALAWIPQSTVACVTNRALVQVSEKMPEVQLLLQVHDSLVGQYPTERESEILPRLKQVIQIPVPYDDPLVIPWGLKTSTKSWGDCNARSWPE